MQDLVIKTGANIPYLLSDNEEKNIIVRVGVQPSDEIRKDFMEKEKVNSGVDLCLVLDVSVSMTDVIEEDNVEYGSRFKVAKKAVESLIKNSSDEDNLSLITYNDLPKIVFKNISGSDKDFMLSELNKVTASGNTNISAAIREARILMKEEVSDKVKKIIFVTDGIPTCDTEEDGIREAEYLGDDSISLDCLGVGNKDIKFSFLEKLEISPLVRITDHYRGTPEKKYLGKAKISSDREYVINIGQIEKDQLYNFYFNVTVSSRVNLKGPFNIMKTSVEYCIPDMYGDNVKTNANVVVVEFGTDSRRSRYRVGDIERNFKMVEIKRYEDEIEEDSKEGNDARVINNLQRIISICEYLKNEELITGYKGILEKYREEKKLDMSKMNENRNTSTKIGDDGLINLPLDIESIFEDQ